jgi:hypothetical protein
MWEPLWDNQDCYSEPIELQRILADRGRILIGVKGYLQNLSTIFTTVLETLQIVYEELARLAFVNNCQDL